jgi:hypothetical protein
VNELYLNGRQQAWANSRGNKSDIYLVIKPNAKREEREMQEKGSPGHRQVSSTAGA